MKRLISVQEVNEAISKGEKYIVVDGNTLVTDAARDRARECGVEIGGVSACVSPCEEPNPVDAEMVYKVLSALNEKGTLHTIQGFLDEIIQKNSAGK